MALDPLARRVTADDDCAGRSADACEAGEAGSSASSKVWSEATWQLALAEPSARATMWPTVLRRLADAEGVSILHVDLHRRANNAWHRGGVSAFAGPRAAEEDVEGLVDRAVATLHEERSGAAGDADDGREDWLPLGVNGVIAIHGRSASAVKVGRGAEPPADESVPAQVASAVATLACRCCMSAPEGERNDPHTPEAIMGKLRLAQRRVLQLLLDGLSEAEVAQRLDVSQGTIHGRVRRIYEAADVETRPKLMAKFIPRRTKRAAGRSSP